MQITHSIQKHTESLNAYRHLKESLASSHRTRTCYYGFAGRILTKPPLVLNCLLLGVSGLLESLAKATCSLGLAAVKITKLDLSAISDVYKTLIFTASGIHFLGLSHLAMITPSIAFGDAFRSTIPIYNLLDEVREILEENQRQLLQAEDRTRLQEKQCLKAQVKKLDSFCHAFDSELLLAEKEFLTPRFMKQKIRGTRASLIEIRKHLATLSQYVKPDTPSSSQIAIPIDADRLFKLILSAELLRKSPLTELYTEDTRSQALESQFILITIFDASILFCYIVSLIAVLIILKRTNPTLRQLALRLIYAMVFLLKLVIITTTLMLQCFFEIYSHVIKTKLIELELTAHTRLISIALRIKKLFPLMQDGDTPRRFGLMGADVHPACAGA